jgi:Holliday junction resolvase RusA-like endonuclease
MRGKEMYNNIQCPIIFDENLKGKKSVYVDIPGEPFAKQRPRAARSGAFITIYTPRETKKYEEKVRRYYHQVYNVDNILEGPLAVEVEGIFPIPKSITKTKAEDMLNGKIKHTKKPDCDNMAKVCLDALNGVAYYDDAQIDVLNISKRYGEEPICRITIRENKT